MNSGIDNEKQSREIFGRLSQDIQPSPFLAGRVTALALERRRVQQQLMWWRRLALISVSTVAILVAVVAVRPSSPSFAPAKEELFALQPYVIHVNLAEAGAEMAASAEVELPDGVQFVAKDEQIKSLRRLKLPVAAVDGSQRTRLPFVVRSERTGQLALQVRLYDANDKLIQSKTLTLNFVGRS